MSGAKSLKTILIIEDDDRLAQAISKIFSGHFALRIAGSIEEARTKLSLIQELDAIIADVMLPDGNGLDLIEEIRESCPALPIVVITGYSSNDISLRVLRLRAELLLKPFEKYHLEMIRDFLKGISRSDVSSNPAELDDPYKNLTERQREVIGLALADYDRHGMCEQLDISRTTLKTHVRHILDKCEAKSLKEVVRRARRKSPHPY